MILFAGFTGNNISDCDFFFLPQAKWEESGAGCSFSEPT